MKALIIYDSYFGNTEQIAQAIGNAFSSKDDVTVLKVVNVKSEHLSKLNLVIVGSPTRKFRPTAAITTFLKRIPDNSLKDVRIAAFDTRIPEEDIHHGHKERLSYPSLSNPEDRCQDQTPQAQGKGIGHADG